MPRTTDNATAKPQDHKGPEHLAFERLQRVAGAYRTPLAISQKHERYRQHIYVQLV